MLTKLVLFISEILTCQSLNSGLCKPVPPVWSLIINVKKKIQISAQTPTSQEGPLTISPTSFPLQRLQKPKLDCQYQRSKYIAFYPPQQAKQLCKQSNELWHSWSTTVNTAVTQGKTTLWNRSPTEQLVGNQSSSVTRSKHCFTKL